MRTQRAVVRMRAPILNNRMRSVSICAERIDKGSCKRNRLTRLIEDDCPNRTLLRKTLYGTTFGSIMHKSDNTRIYVHTQVYSCKMDRVKPEAEAGQIALKEERHQYILALLGSEGRVLAADLSSRYRVSEDTIRRDLRELASSGKIQ